MTPASSASPHTLVAGIGNVFLGDDGFGVEVVRRLLLRARGPGVVVVDFGIRGLDLAYALMEPWTRVILVDAAPRGRLPGTLHVLETTLAAVAETHAGAVYGQGHGVPPAEALAFVAASRPAAPRLCQSIWIVGCEPAVVPADDALDVDVGLSPEVAAVVDEAVRLVEVLVETPGPLAHAVMEAEAHA